MTIEDRNLSSFLQVLVVLAAFSDSEKRKDEHYDNEKKEIRRSGLCIERAKIIICSVEEDRDEDG